MKSLLIIPLFVAALNVNAGIPEHLVYDARDRYQLDKLDLIVSVDIENYFAFSDIGLVQTFREAKTIPKVPDQEGYSTSSIDATGNELIYDSFPDINAGLQLKRNSIWIFDVCITECIKGSIETNRLLVALKPTRAYDNIENPYTFLSTQADDDIVFGLIRLNKEEFSKSLLGLVCYLENSLEFFELDHLDTRSPSSYYAKPENLFQLIDKYPCYVAREIGVNFILSPHEGTLIKQKTESRLIQELSKKTKQTPSIGIQK